MSGSATPRFPVLAKVRSFVSSSGSEKSGKTTPSKSEKVTKPKKVITSRSLGLTHMAIGSRKSARLEQRNSAKK